MTHPYSAEDLGIDTHAVLKTCMACRKQSDNAKTCGDGTVLCGTHFDEWLRMSLKQRAVGHIPDTAARYADALRVGPFKPCWEAQLTEGEPT